MPDLRPLDSSGIEMLFGGAAIAKPGKKYPETMALKSTRPTGSGDL
jgi:hypothetical protein